MKLIVPDVTDEQRVRIKSCQHLNKLRNNSEIFTEICISHRFMSVWVKWKCASGGLLRHVHSCAGRASHWCFYARFAYLNCTVVRAISHPVESLGQLCPNNKLAPWQQSLPVTNVYVFVPFSFGTALYYDLFNSRCAIFAEG